MAPYRCKVFENPYNFLYDFLNFVDFVDLIDTIDFVEFVDFVDYVDFVDGSILSMSLISSIRGNSVFLIVLLPLVLIMEH